MVTDARYRTKVYLDTYIIDATIINQVPAAVTNTVMYAYPPYPLYLLFSEYEQDFGVVFFIGKPTSKAKYTAARGIYAYDESIPIHCHAIDKTNLIAELTLQHAEAEVRRVLETYPIAADYNTRLISEAKTHTIREGSTVFYGWTITVDYVRVITT